MCDMCCPHLAVGGHQFAKDRSVIKAASVDNNDVARLGQIHGLVEHQVIPLGHLDGKGNPYQGNLVQRPDALMDSGSAAHVVVNVGHRHSPEGLYQLRIRADKIRHYFTANVAHTFSPICAIAAAMFFTAWASWSSAAAKEKRMRLPVLSP